MLYWDKINTRLPKQIVLKVIDLKDRCLQSVERGGIKILEYIIHQPSVKEFKPSPQALITESKHQ